MNKNNCIFRIFIFTITAIIFAAAVLPTFAQKSNDKLWRQIDENNLPSRENRSVTPEKYRVFRLNQTALKNSLADLPLENTDAADTKNVIMEIPMPDGSIQSFRMEETSVLSPELAAAFPDWKSFVGYGIDDKSAIGRFDWNALGFHGYIETDHGIVFIDPYSKGDTNNYLVFYKHEFGRSAVEFYDREEKNFSKLVQSDYQAFLPSVPEFMFGATVRTYRLAVATTGEWSRNAAGYNGSQNPLQIRSAAFAVVMTAVNRLNGIYIRELASQFQLVNPSRNNNLTNIIFDDPATDPYDNTDNTAQLTINNTTLNNRVGAQNYDIGHLFGTGGGGVASSPSVCSPQKGEGYSARGTETGDPFVVDYVAHEIGHQFGASHTYNNNDPSGACTTRSAMNAFEVASGSTIMSYVGICDMRNLQQYNDFALPAFHIRSMTEINNNLTDQNGDPQQTGCGTASGTNAIPTVNAGASYTIPKLTPFTLTATGGDADAGDVSNLLYSWEEYDLAPSPSGTAGTPPGTYDVDTDGVLRPLFRAYSPDAGNSRTFPSMNFILNPANNDPAGSNQPFLTYTGTHPTGKPGAVCETGMTCVVGERLPTVSRTMNYRVSLRDRRGGVADAGTTVTIAGGAGPFQITTQNSSTANFQESFAAFAPAATWQSGTTQTVTWDVANTNAAPVNTANVNILLSTDGGQTFPITLAANTTNDGTESITVPNNPTSTARIKVEAVGNIYFDINNADFAITAPTAAAVTLNGRVVTSTGRGIRNVRVQMTDANGIIRTATTSTFGYYRFDDVEVGETYILTARAKTYSFPEPTQVVSVSENAAEVNFIAYPYKN